MRLRVEVEYPDDVAPSVEVFGDAIRHLDRARAWQKAVVTCHPDALDMDAEVECDADHGWQDMMECEACSIPLCWKCVEEDRRTHGDEDTICEGCREDRDDDEPYDEHWRGVPNHWHEVKG